MLSFNHFPKDTGKANGKTCNLYLFFILFIWKKVIPDLPSIVQQLDDLSDMLHILLCNRSMKREAADRSHTLFQFSVYNRTHVTILHLHSTSIACLKLTSKCNTLHYIATLHSITQHNTLCQQYNVKNRWKLKYIVPATPNETMWYYNIVLCPLSIIILCWDVTNITLAP